MRMVRYPISICWVSPVQFSPSVVSDSLWPHGLQHSRFPCPLPTPGACSNSCPLSRWCHPTVSSSVVPFSSCLQSFPASGSFAKSQFFTPGDQSIGVSASASVLPVNIQGWFPLGLAGWIWVALWKAWEPGCLDSNISSITNQLCGLGNLPSLSVSQLPKLRNRWSQYWCRCYVRKEWVNMGKY